MAVPLRLSTRETPPIGWTRPVASFRSRATAFFTSVGPPIREPIKAILHRQNEGRTEEKCRSDNG